MQIGNISRSIVHSHFTIQNSSLDYTEHNSGTKKLKPAKTLHSTAEAFSHNTAYYLFSAYRH